MAAVKIGLDFGTHYTKICIEHSADKRNKRYQFHRFFDQNGDFHYVFPSVVQLNRDNTLSYGFVDYNKAKLVEVLPEKNPPQKPTEPKYRSYKQFPELIEPVRDQFFSNIVCKEASCVAQVSVNSEEDKRLKDVKARCIRHFKLLFKCHAWEDANSDNVISIINNFTTDEINKKVSEHGVVDIDALVKMAVAHSYSQIQEQSDVSIQPATVDLDDIQAKCLSRFNSFFKFHVWENAAPSRVKAAIKDLTIADVEASTKDGEIDIDALINLAVLRSNTPGYALKNKKNKNDKGAKLVDKNCVVRRHSQKDRRQQMKEAQMLYENARGEFIKMRIKREADIVRDKNEVDAYNRGLREEYERRMKLWMEYEQGKDKPIPAVFRSFKQMVFSEGYDWRFELDPMLVAIWYLCYLFFDLDKEYGTQYLTVCMGTSSGQDNWESNKEKATQIVLTVYDLIENVFNHNKERFLSATLDELMKVTKIKPFSQADKEANEITVFPEAFANLNPLAKQRKFGAGVNAVVDIGGGTTDISIFFVLPTTNELKIFDYVSIPYGVNAIDKEGRDVHFNAVKRKMDFFSRTIQHEYFEMGGKLGKAKSMVTDRPILFAGGGSMRPELRRPYEGFSDVMHIGSSLLNSYSIDDAVEIADKIPLLSTSLGLVLCGKDDSEIPIKTYKTFLEKLEGALKEEVKPNEFEYEHGMTDD